MRQKSRSVRLNGSCISCGREIDAEPMRRGPRRRFCAKCRAEREVARTHTRSPEAIDRRQARDRLRPPPSKRGYGSAHRRLREIWGDRVKEGGIRCARCGKPIRPGDKWDLGHDDVDRKIYRGPEHQRCNRATATHAAERRHDETWLLPKRRQSRVW